MDRDRFARIAVVIATFVLAPVLLEMLAWYIEGEDYNVSRALTVLAVVGGLAVIALVVGRIRGRLPVMVVGAMTVASVGGLIIRITSRYAGQKEGSSMVRHSLVFVAPRPDGLQSGCGDSAVLEPLEHRPIGTNGYVSTWGAITGGSPPKAV
ncbi:hypothetical protein ACTWPT_11480 [Nonomuraea sp. 3N208]|uniref:hypothetical protein n=1 Tax=Nonomuraea sp. 3N208 TaxID=3457421 RepID=UPI003FCCD946